MIARPKASGLSWGVSTLGCPDLRFPQICQLLSEFALHELEFRAVDGRIDLPQWAVDAGWIPFQATGLLAKHDIRFVVADSSFKLVGNDEKSRAELLAFCEWADSWSARYVRAFGGGTWGQALTEEDYDQAALTIAWWQQERKQRGWAIELLLETHDAFCASSSCRQLLARLHEPIGIIWDSHHTWRLGGETPRESWSQLSQWIRHVHVKDSVNKPSARHPYTYVLPGDGDMPVGQVVEVLSEHHFPGVVSLEWERLWHPYLPLLREALARLQAQPWFLAAGEESVNEAKSPVIAS
jgi:sugar phosphate isomerase/epimerase